MSWICSVVFQKVSFPATANMEIVVRIGVIWVFLAGIFRNSRRNSLCETSIYYSRRRFREKCCFAMKII